MSNSNFVASDVEHYYRKQLQQKQESHKAALSRIEDLVRAMPHPEDCWHRGVLLAEIARAKAAA